MAPVDQSPAPCGNRHWCPSVRNYRSAWDCAGGRDSHYPQARDNCPTERSFCVRHARALRILGGLLTSSRHGRYARPEPRSIEGRSFGPRLPADGPVLKQTHELRRKALWSSLRSHLPTQRVVDAPLGTRCPVCAGKRTESSTTHRRAATLHAAADVGARSAVPTASPRETRWSLR